MARGRKPPRAYVNCPRCHALIPTSYYHCSVCGHDRRKPAPITTDELIARAKETFPGSYEP